MFIIISKYPRLSNIQSSLFPNNFTPPNTKSVSFNKLMHSSNHTYYSKPSLSRQIWDNSKTGGLAKLAS